MPLLLSGAKTPLFPWVFVRKSPEKKERQSVFNHGLQVNESMVRLVASMTGVMRGWLIAALLVCAWASPAGAAMPLAGTAITNQAFASFVDQITGVRTDRSSNVVQVTVAPLEAVLLIAPRTLFGAPANQIVFSHRITNSGNTPTTFRLNYRNDTGDSFDLNGLTLHQDVVLNGLFDSGEPLINDAGTVFLFAGQSIDLILVGSTPAGAVPGQFARATLSTTSVSDATVTAANVDEIRITDAAELTLGKSASATSIRVGEVIGYTLGGRNIGGVAATGINVTIDGLAASRVVIRDAIPANTQLAEVLTTNGPQPLYHLAGELDLHRYVSSAPGNLAQVDAIAFSLPVVNPFLSINQGYSGAFKVRVNSTASGSVTNRASIYYQGGAAATVVSNEVTTTLQALPPTIRYYTSPSFTRVATVARLGSPLYVEADAAMCNVAPTTAETVSVVVTAEATGDRETFTAVETGPNTGKFQIQPNVPTRNSQTSQPGNGVVEAIRNDSIKATIDGCGAGMGLTIILIDPFGVVFDAASNQPLEAAIVKILNADGSPAQVFDVDSVTSLPNEVTTGVDGSYQFLVVAPCAAGPCYRLQITPPPGYTLHVPAGELFSGHVMDAQGSYGALFDVSLATGVVRLDIPMDVKPKDGLMVEKTVKRNLVELGDFVDYQVNVSNGTQSDLQNVIISDNLPAGFYYVRGSARLAVGNVSPPVFLPSADPAPSAGAIHFSIGNLANAQSAKLTYRVRTGVGAIQGDGINRAQAIAGNTRSNAASVKVTVQPGVFSDKAFVIGKVFLDCNNDRIQSGDELGIPGVRLYMEDGTYVISDAEGKYSFYGVSARTHVLKLDQTTMPADSELFDLSNRNAGDPGSRFIDVKQGELHKANFAEGSCSDAVVEQVKARRAKAERGNQEAQQALKTQLSADGQPVNIGDPRALAATGIIGGGVTTNSSFQSVATESITSSEGLTTRAKLPPTSESATPPAVDIEKLAKSIDNSLGFVGLKDQDTLPFAQTTIRIKGMAGATLALKVNDEEISEKRVGKKSTILDKQTEVWEYIGVNLVGGKNTLTASQVDGFGNARGNVSIIVIAPDKLGKVKVIVPTSGSPADGATPARIIVKLSDSQDVPVTVRTPVTLETDIGRFDVEDLNTTEPGVQVFIEGGQQEFPLLPPREPGQGTIRATSGITKGDAKLDFMPDLRPLIATGVIEGVVNLRNVNTRALVPSREQDGFEQELKQFSYENDGGKRAAGARAAFFLKGKIKGDYLLTAAYDSDKDTKERLFRDIQPDEFYPVYGDSAVKGFDAQSTSRFYVRVDKQKSYLLFGDFTTQASSELRKLGNYVRSLTGARHHYENARVTVNTFASLDSTRQVVEEIAGNGTSGPYDLTKPGLLENGERVEIITRDRNQSAVILKSVEQSRFADYGIDVTTGRILFRSPVPSLDENLNPIFIRVTYEIDQGGEKYWVAGIDAQVKVTDKIEIGAVYVIDRNPQSPATLENNVKQIIGVNGAIKLTDKTLLVAEVVQTEGFDGKKGLGERLELKYKDERLVASVYWGKTDDEFKNPGASQGRGRVEAGAKAAYKLDDKTRILGEILHTEDTIANGKRDGQLIAVERLFENNIRAEIGVRHSDETATAAQDSSVGTTPNEFTSIRGKISAPVPMMEKANVFGEYEQDIENSDRKLVAIGGDYKISSRAKLYARHEFISTLSGPFSLNANQSQNATVIGIDSDYMKGGHLFNEYRVRDSVSGREAEAAIGLRNLWNVAPGILLNTNFERVHAVGGTAGNESTAGAFGVEYTANPLWKGTARIELRYGTESDSLLHTVGLGFKLNKDWTLLGKNIISLTKNKGAVNGEKWLERFQFGVAYRDTDDDVWNGLARIEHKVELDTTQIDQETKRNVEIVSTHVNYQPRSDLIFSARFAAKWLTDLSNGSNDKSNAQLVGIRGTYDISSHWDVSTYVSTMFSRGATGRQNGVGVEVGYMLTSNLWLSAGYNFFGFKGDELSGGDYTNQGAFLRMRFKFDEDLFAAKNSKVNNTLPRN